MSKINKDINDNKKYYKKYKNYFIYAYNKDYYKNKQTNNYQNTENLKFIKIKNWYLKYAPL